ncbi:hypothetical protein TARUN_6469 [Trichoderma arundinaceum]|uniref:Uncharacterized protein n=1 Tax=Trichoderma arundinaceum TaxID=490622 RepID=A0A395NI46_TRIAR|nr:hypothetical protein TARUN_6469 [Trichoderma arundinaceum]
MDTPPGHPLDRTVNPFLRPEALEYSVNQQRHHIDQLIRQGRISLSEGTILTVGPDLMIRADGMEPLTPQILATQAPSLYVGSNTPSCSSEYFHGHIGAWAEVPEEAHWAWHQGLEQLKNLREGDRHEGTLRELIRTARADDKDVLLLHQSLSMTSVLQLSTDEDLYVNLPLAFGRVLGIAPPSDSPPNNLWADHFLLPAFQRCSYLSATITGAI